MFYRVCRIINIAVSCLFIGIIILSLFGAKEFLPEVIVAISIISLSSIFFIFFDIICGRLYKFNNENIPVTKQLKKTGKIIFAFNLLSALAISFLVIAGVYAFINDSPGEMKERWPLYFSMFAMFGLAAITGIINLIGFRNLLKKNQAITTGIIDDIGK